jgi:hypothetical protein
MNRPNRLLEAVLLVTIVGLTLATGYIHFWVGGILLTLNAAGYLALALMVVGSAALWRRGLPLVLLALAGYAGVTICGWLVMGPYFDVAYLAKAIEIGLIGAIAVELRLLGGEVRLAIAWTRSLPRRLIGRLRPNAGDSRSPVGGGE